MIMFDDKLWKLVVSNYRRLRKNERRRPKAEYVPRANCEGSGTEKLSIVEVFEFRQRKKSQPTGRKVENQKESRWYLFVIFSDGCIYVTRIFLCTTNVMNI